MQNWQHALIPGVDPKPQQDEGHAEERRAFEFALQELPFAEVYAAMVAKGYRWREAAFVAWSVLPRESRTPKTKGELAELLGCGRDKITSLEQDKRLITERLLMARLAYLEQLPDIIDASIEVAKKPSYKATPERNNIINKVLGLGPDRVQVQAGNAGAFDELSEADLAQQALGDGVDDGDTAD